jgi:DNA (cytosine-5)-methyltransferase 1
VLNGLALCAGVGGLELGLKLALGEQYRTVGYVEREAYAAAVLVARMEDKALDPAPCWDDLSTFDGNPWRGVVDIVSAGFPCQGFSTATRGRARQVNLWPEVARIVSEVGPRWVFLENVCRAPWAMVEADLDRLGFDHERTTCCPSEFGAPHKRPRTFLLAYAHGQGKPWGAVNGEVASVPEDAGDGGQAESRVVGMDDGTRDRVHRLRALGNAVVPLVAAHSFRVLAARLRG